MKKLFLIGLALWSILPNAQAQATLIEKVEPKPGKLIVPYSKYQYPNGLTLMVSEDHSDPVAHLNVTYHVGSARETRENLDLHTFSNTCCSKVHSTWPMRSILKLSKITGAM